MVRAGAAVKIFSGSARLKRDVIALRLAVRDPEVPWDAKAVAGLVAAYALSPIDLIPDVVPALGYLDDLVVVPHGVLLALRLIPPERMADLRVKAEAMGARPVSRAGLVAVGRSGGRAAGWSSPSSCDRYRPALDRPGGRRLSRSQDVPAGAGTRIRLPAAAVGRERPATRFQDVQAFPCS